MVEEVEFVEQHLSLKSPISASALIHLHFSLFRASGLVLCKVPPCWVSGCRSLSSLLRPVLNVLDKFLPPSLNTQHCPWTSP